MIPTNQNDIIETKIRIFEDKYPFPQEQIDRTERRRWLANRLPKHGIGAEIGVFRGHFSEVLTSTLSPRKFYMIDPWTKCGNFFGWGGGYTNNNTLLTDDAREEAICRATRGGVNDLIVVEDYFPKCVHLIRDPLDWAYLDASHKYASTLEELIALEKLMKPNGIISGDDWRPNPSDRHHGVYCAVQEFTQKTDWEIVMCGYLGQWILRRKRFKHHKLVQSLP